MGIASFVISVSIAVLMLMLFAVAGYLSSHRPIGAVRYPGQVTIGLIMIVLIAADIVAIGLGVASLFQSERKRVLGVLGLVFSVMTVLGTIVLIAIGIAMMVARHRM